MYEKESEKSLGDLKTAIKGAIQRYWAIALFPSLAVTGLLVCLGIYLPSYYVTDAKLIIQPPKVTSARFADPSGRKEDLNEKLAAIIQDVLSRPRLRSIREQFKLYPQFTGASGPQQAINKFRTAISVDTDTKTGTGNAQVFVLQFTHEDPKIAFEVTKALSNLFVDESALNSKSEAEGTKGFLEAQVEKTKKTLETIEAQIQAFSKENFDQLPENLKQVEAQLTSAQRQLEVNNTRMSALGDRRRFQASELQEIGKTTTVSTNGGESDASPQDALERLQATLEVLKSRYTAKHPDVIATEKRIELIKSRLGNSKSGGKGTRVSATGSRDYREAKRQINDIDIEIKALQKDNESLRDSITKLTKSISVMPLKNQELIKIKRDYATVNDSYQSLLKEKQNADMKSNLVNSTNNAQFRIIDPPAEPFLPAGPIRSLFIGGGFVGGLAVFAIIPLIGFFINPAYKSGKDLEADLGIKLLGIIPPMDTSDVVRRRRFATASSLLLSIIAFGVGCVVIFFMV